MVEEEPSLLATMADYAAVPFRLVALGIMALIPSCAADAAEKGYKMGRRAATIGCRGASVAAGCAAGMAAAAAKACAPQEEEEATQQPVPGLRRSRK